MEEACFYTETDNRGGVSAAICSISPEGVCIIITHKLSNYPAVLCRALLIAHY